MHYNQTLFVIYQSITIDLFWVEVFMQDSRGHLQRSPWIYAPVDQSWLAACRAPAHIRQ